MKGRSRVFLLLMVLGLAIGLYPPPATARADGDDIEVVEMAAESQFPDSIRFSITARSSDEIDEVRVFFRKVGGARGSAYRVVEFEPGLLVTGKAVLRSGSGTNYIPPGTVIAYSFEVRDKGERVRRTPEREMMYTDNRFDWKSVSSGLITVYYYGENAEEKAAAVVEGAEKAMERMAPLLGIEPTEPLRVISYSDYRHMSSAIPFRAQAVTEQLRTEGMAFADERVLLVYTPDATAKGTASHEFTHLLVAQATGRARPRVPAWLSEGLAEYGNIEPAEDFDDALRRAISTRRLQPLWYLGTFAGKPDDIIIAYGQSRSVVQHMISRHGAAKMAQLMRVFQETLEIDQALERVYGLDQHGLDAEWRASLGLDPLPSPEEPEHQLRERRTAEPARTANPEPTPTPRPTPAASLEDGGAPRPSPGCGAGAAPGAAAGLAMLALLGAPLATLSWRGFRRRRQ